MDKITRRERYILPITYQIKSGVQFENDIRFTLEVVPMEVSIQASGQMLVDSDGMAFVYLLEDNTGYQYLKFGQEVWPLLVSALKAEDDPTIQFGSQRIVLHNFKEELKSLVYNIEGNDNYGEDFSQAVELTFKEILQA